MVEIGINFKGSQSTLPEELRHKAGFLYTDEPPATTRNHLAAEIINQLCILCDTLELRSFLPEYRMRSMIIGEQIRFLRNQVWSEALAVDIDDNGGLIIALSDNKRETLSSGEVSVRRLEQE